jgi:hypothetical protein
MRRIVFSISFSPQNRKVQLVFTSTKSRRNFYTQVERQSFHTAWTHIGQIASGHRTEITWLCQAETRSWVVPQGLARRKAGGRKAKRSLWTSSDAFTGPLARRLHRWRRRACCPAKRLRLKRVQDMSFEEKRSRLMRKLNISEFDTADALAPRQTNLLRLLEGASIDPDRKLWSIKWTRAGFKADSLAFGDFIAFSQC